MKEKQRWCGQIIEPMKKFIHSLELLKGPENILGVLEQVEAVKIVQLHNGL